MRKNFGSKSWLYPMPVFIIGSYNKNDQPNAMNAAWGGIYTDSMIGICMSNKHQTTANILVNKAFTVSMGTVDQLMACDYVGLVSGKNEPHKFSKAGFHAIPSTFVHAPIITEFPMTLECELVSYNEDTNFLIGKIVNISVDETILDENGAIDPAKLQPILYDPCNHHYLKVGEIVGNAFSDGRKIK